MLQRKYFQDGEALQFKHLLAIAISIAAINPSAKMHFESRLDYLRNWPIELALSDGTLVNDQIKNVEDVTYGTLLHGDLERTLRNLKFPPEMRLLSLAPYILTREELLFELRDVLIAAGVVPLRFSLGERAVILREIKAAEQEMAITSSPYWANIIGRDASIDDLNAIVRNNTFEDNCIILHACQFIDLLREESLNKKKLRVLVWRRNWLAPNCFEQAAKIARGVDNLGFSTHVRHAGGPQYSQVLFLPNVIGPWITETPQLLPRETITVCLTKRRNIWRIERMLGPHDID